MWFGLFGVCVKWFQLILAVDKDIISVIPCFNKNFADLAKIVSIIQLSDVSSHKNILEKTSHMRCVCLHVLMHINLHCDYFNSKNSFLLFLCYNIMTQRYLQRNRNLWNFLKRTFGKSVNFISRILMCATITLRLTVTGYSEKLFYL